MRLIFRGVEHVLRFEGGYVNELVVEHRRLFFDMVQDLLQQMEGDDGRFVLSLSDRPVELCKHADVTLQFTPFPINRKPLLTKLYATLEQRALLPENYQRTSVLLADLERYVLQLGEELPFDLDSRRLAIGPVLRAVAPELSEGDLGALERIFAYMALVRELDHDRLFVMVNMRTYFSDEDMASFVESVCLHDFRVLLLESVSFPALRDVRRYTVDADLCEF